jgi:hypothetical protein
MIKKQILFEPGYNHIDFKCTSDKPKVRKACDDGSNGHGIHGMSIRFLYRGSRGAVQFLMNTGVIPGRIPSILDKEHTVNPYAVDLGYHSFKPHYDEQSSMGPCDFLDGAECYYDGSSLNAEVPWRILHEHGLDALWEYLEGYYDATFRDGEYPEEPESKLVPR